MSYEAEPSLANQPGCTGVLLTNLGTPDAPTKEALVRYLGEFLWDPRVVEKSRLIWWPALHGVILRIRPRKAAKAYAKVWTEDGSPLLAISKRQAVALQQALEQRSAGRFKVELAMRYGNPSIRAGLEALKRANAQRVLVLPLYPQYSATTTASTVDAVSDVFKSWRVIPELRTVNGYWHEPGYIEALAQSIRRHWDTHGQAEKLLFSFHGLPQRYVEAGDPYQGQCQCTANLVAAELQLRADQWQVAFQSRFGPEQWLQPYTDETLRTWGGQGLKSVDVLSPGFSADCLETLEEIDQENREIFQHAGGGEYRYIAALNDDAAHIAFLSDLVHRQTQGWD